MLDQEHNPVRPANMSEYKSKRLCAFEKTSGYNKSVIKIEHVPEICSKNESERKNKTQQTFLIRISNSNDMHI